MKHLALIAMASMATIQFAHAQQYTFGPEVQSTPSASITYDSQTGTFQYTDTANSSDDSAYLPLTGSAATFITASNDWTASVTVNLSGRSMTATGTDEWPHAFMVLGVLTSSSTHVIIELIQANNTEGGGSSDYPDGFYGTVARFAAKANGVGAVTTPLSNSLSSSGGGSYLQLSGQTGPPDSPSTESISAVSGVLTLSFNASTDILTGYYNGTPVGSYSLAGWGSNPPMTLVVSGGSGEGVGVPAGTVTASGFTATEPGYYTITVSASPSGGGKVTGNGTFASGSLRTVTAKANSGYKFADWTEDGSVLSLSASYS